MLGILPEPIVLNHLQQIVLRELLPMVATPSLAALFGKWEEGLASKLARGQLQLRAPQVECTCHACTAPGANLEVRMRETLGF